MQRLMILTFSLICLSLIAGCSTGPGGSQQAAEEFFHAEFQKWIAEQPSELMLIGVHSGSSYPISYDIRSIAVAEPNPLATKIDSKLPENWKEWPAYKFNVVIEWKSQAETPLEKVVSFHLTWNPTEQKWYVST